MTNTRKKNITHKATYLDSGFYVVSDRAAGDLCRVLGQGLPKAGWQKVVMLKVHGLAFGLNAWLTRTPTSLSPGRKWRWAIYALRPDGDKHGSITLGREFTFAPVKSTDEAELDAMLAGIGTR